jgi:anti-sigma B factor antagonist
VSAASDLGMTASGANRWSNRRMDVTSRTLDDGTVVLTPVGELDVHTADVLRDAVRAAESGAPGVITVELAGVSFMDSTGLGVLIGALTRARERKGRIVLAAPVPRVARLLALTGMDEQFEITS